jgi:uroporphyrinogen decarboxylase
MPTTLQSVAAPRPTRDCDFLRACSGKPVVRRPIWIMRQAGRYQASYRAVREKHSFEELCATPDLIAQVTCAPIAEFDLDAAIIFSDILVVFPPMGLPVRFDDGGPKIATPIRMPADLSRLKPLDPNAVRFVTDGIRQARAALPANIPLIGFAGAPFTLACYAIEGTTSREFAIARRFFHEHTAQALRLIEHLASAVGDYLSAQVDAGVDAIQLFDSWGGLLSREDYANWILPTLQSITAKLKGRVPTILYLNGTSHLVDILDQAGFDVLSVDWRTDLAAAAKLAQHATAIQGNLDPLALFGSQDQITQRARTIMDTMARTHKGHIFNLGHGILPNTPESHLRALVEAVHSKPPKG